MVEVHEAADPSTPSSSPCKLRVGGVVRFVNTRKALKFKPADAHRAGGLFA
jgi:hypothetical protein